MHQDTFGEVINGIDTYKGIVNELRGAGRCLVGWTDQSGTHLDILFVYRSPMYGSNIQGGVRGTDLFVSIMRMGAFGFESVEKDTHHGYYAEKLGLGGGTTAEALAVLINGVKEQLDK